MRDGNRRRFGGEGHGRPDRIVLGAPGRRRSAREERRAGRPLRGRDPDAGILHRRRFARARCRRRGSPGRNVRTGRELLSGEGSVADPLPPEGTGHGDPRLRGGKLSNRARSEPRERRAPGLRDPSRRKVARARHDARPPRGRASPFGSSFRRNALSGHRRRATLPDCRRDRREGARLESRSGRPGQILRGGPHDFPSIPRRPGQRNVRPHDPGAALQAEGARFRLGVERVLRQRNPLERKDASEDPDPPAGESDDPSSRNRALGRLRVLARGPHRHRRPLRLRDRLLPEDRDGREAAVQGTRLDRRPDVRAAAPPVGSAEPEGRDALQHRDGILPAGARGQRRGPSNRDQRGRSLLDRGTNDRRRARRRDEARSDQPGGLRREEGRSLCLAAADGARHGQRPEIPHSRSRASRRARGRRVCFEEESVRRRRRVL